MVAQTCATTERFVVSSALEVEEIVFQSAVELLRCPTCHGKLRPQRPKRKGDEILSGTLGCTEDRSHHYPIERGIPRFVPPENYAGSFGFEWTLYGDLQVDRLGDHTITRDRFYQQMGCGPEDLAGLRVLEVGCGGGRFSDVVLDAGAELFAVDLSVAVEKNRELHPAHPRLHLAQASIYDLPFAREAFDLVFCFGVLQHTPDPHASFEALVPFVKPGGRLAVDIYAAHPKQTSHWKYAVRPIAKRISPERLHAAIARIAPVLVPISRRVRRIPKVGKPLSRLIPIMVHDGFMGKLRPEEEVRWAILETLDALSPAYDRPRSRRTLHRWFEQSGLVDVETNNVMNALNYGRGRRPT